MRPLHGVHEEHAAQVQVVVPELGEEREVKTAVLGEEKVGEKDVDHHAVTQSPKFLMLIVKKAGLRFFSRKKMQAEQLGVTR